jgi:hypothetical protein
MSNNLVINLNDTKYKKSLTDYFRIKPFVVNTKIEKEIQKIMIENDKIIDLNRKSGNFIHYLFESDKYGFEILYGYCRDCNIYNEKTCSKLKFKLTTYGPFIDFTNYYNLTEEDNIYFRNFEIELEEHFDRLNSLK